jgi:hypothetical protein
MKKVLQTMQETLLVLALCLIKAIEALVVMMIILLLSILSKLRLI